MMLLISLAILVAFVASLASEFGVLDLEFWWELALLIDVMLLGHWQEMRALGQASGALEALAALLPDEAEMIHGDMTHTVPVAELRPGDLVLVRPGGRVPADGTIVDGEAEFDESMITGESQAGRPRAAAIASWPARWRPTARSGSGSTPSGDDTTLAGIQRLVDGGAGVAVAGAGARRPRRRAPVLRRGRRRRAHVRRVERARRHGRGGRARRHRARDRLPARARARDPAGDRDLDRRSPPGPGSSSRTASRSSGCATVDAVLFDKTGTLTRGEHVVTRASPAPASPRDEVLRLAAAVEADSEHPLARAIVAAARSATARSPRASGFRSLTGRGVDGVVDGVDDRGRWSRVAA